MRVNFATTFRRCFKEGQGENTGQALDLPGWKRVVTIGAAVF